MPLLTCEHLKMAYDKAIVVDDVSFALNEGDYLCVVGENGAGKSTLLKGVLGLVKPLSGSIRYEGLSQKEVGYLPQQTVVQKDFPASVYEVVLSGCLNASGFFPFYKKKDRQRAEATLAQLGMAALKNRSYRELSGGQQQRVLLARALCATQKLLLLDEPTSGLDPIVAAEFYALIEDLNKNHGITVLMISHDVASAVRYGSKILHLARTAEFFGPTAEYLNTEAGRRMTGGAPHV